MSGNILQEKMETTQPEITRQRPFELTDIEYDLIKGEIANMERFE